MLISPFEGNLKRKRPIKSSRMDNPIVKVNFNRRKVEQFYTWGGASQKKGYSSKIRDD
jgi:hypothetical protein